MQLLDCYCRQLSVQLGIVLAFDRAHPLWGVVEHSVVIRRCSSVTWSVPDSIETTPQLWLAGRADTGVKSFLPFLFIIHWHATLLTPIVRVVSSISITAAAWRGSRLEMFQMREKWRLVRRSVHTTPGARIHVRWRQQCLYQVHLLQSRQKRRQASYNHSPSIQSPWHI